LDTSSFLTNPSRHIAPARTRSPAHSYLAKILVEDGDVAKVGSTVALIAATQYAKH
jgi:hypothetical protein